jgi:hypothetical protein
VRQRKRKKQYVLLPCLRPSLEGQMNLRTFGVTDMSNLKTFGVTDMSKYHMMSQCVTYISFPNWYIFAILHFSV